MKKTNFSNISILNWNEYPSGFMNDWVTSWRNNSENVLTISSLYLLSYDRSSNYFKSFAVITSLVNFFEDVLFRSFALQEKLSKYSDVKNKKRIFTRNILKSHTTTGKWDVAFQLNIEVFEDIIERFYQIYLTHFWPMFPFYTPWKHQRFSGVFGGHKWKHWPEMG